MGKCSTLNQSETDLEAVAANTTLVNDIRAKLKGDYNFSLPGLAIGSTTTAVSNVAFDYIIGGIRYTKAGVAAGTAPGNDVIGTRVCTARIVSPVAGGYDPGVIASHAVFILCDFAEQRNHSSWSRV